MKASWWERLRWKLGLVLMDRAMLSSVQLLSHVQLFVAPWIAPCQASLSITNSRSLPKLMSIGSVMPSSHFILCHPWGMLSKSLMQFSVDGQDLIPSLFFDLRPNYGEGNKDNGTLLQKVPCRHCCTQIWDSHKFIWDSPKDEWGKKNGKISWMRSQQTNVKILKVLPWWFKAKTPCSKHR